MDETIEPDIPDVDPSEEQKAYDPAADPSSRSGRIGGISVNVEWLPYEGSQTTNWCYVVVSASSPDHKGGDIELIRHLLGIYKGDERPTVSHWTSTPNGVATGKWLPIATEPAHVG